MSTASFCRCLGGAPLDAERLNALVKTSAIKARRQPPRGPPQLSAATVENVAVNVASESLVLQTGDDTYTDSDEEADRILRDHRMRTAARAQHERDEAELVRRRPWIDTLGPAARRAALQRAKERRSATSTVQGERSLAGGTASGGCTSTGEWEETLWGVPPSHPDLQGGGCVLHMLCRAGRPSAP